MSFSYTQKRANRNYKEGKQPPPSIPSFKHLSKVLFFTSMGLTLIYLLVLVVASGSFVVLVCALTGLVFVLYAVHLEEKHSVAIFSEYKNYMKTTSKMIPYIY